MKKSPGPDRFIAKFYKNFKGNLMPMLFKLFNVTKREVIQAKLFLGASINQIQRAEKGTTKKKTTNQFF